MSEIALWFEYHGFNMLVMFYICFFFNDSNYLLVIKSIFEKNENTPSCCTLWIDHGTCSENGAPVSSNLCYLIC